MAKVTIDSKEMEFPDGTSLFDACREARGEDLPHFCYHPDLPIAGVCRLCQVEVEGMPKLTIACNTTVRDGMVVHTRNERVRKAQQNILEMHLINHPVDCSICDQAGECGLQDQYMKFGLYESHVEKSDKVLKFKAKVVGPRVILDSERCVLCSRCVRFCREVTKTGELGIFNRGDRAIVDIAPGKELNNNYSLCTVDICPVGALTSRDFRFQKRVWLLKGTESICPGCATGCNIRIDHEAETIYRLKPVRNDEVNGPWMCDMGRITYRNVHAENRLAAPWTRRNGSLTATDWPGAWEELKALKSGDGFALTTGAQSLEELHVFAHLARTLCGGRIAGGPREALRGEGDELLLDGDRLPNRASLDLLGLPQMSAADIVEVITSATGPILVYGGDPALDSEAIAAALKGRDFVYIGTHMNETAKSASTVLPVSAWAEKDGIFVNRQIRLQAFTRAVAGPELAVEDWRLFSEWLAMLETDDVYDTLNDLRRRLGNDLPALANVKLEALPRTGVVIGAANAAGEVSND